MNQHLSRAEIAKDTVQHVVESGAETVANVTGILAGAVRDVAREFGGFATELFEIREASKRAGVETHEE